MSHQHTHNYSCRELLEQIHDYIDGELETKLCAELEQHLNECKDCQVMVDTTKKTLVLFRRQYRQNQVKLSADTTARLWKSLEEAGCVKE